MNNQKLYALKNDPSVIGNIIAQNRQNKLIFDPINETDIRLIDSYLQLEEVVPYTIDIQFANQHKRYSFLSDADIFEVNDILVQEDGSFARVVAVDTKAHHAMKYFKGQKVVTSKIKYKSEGVKH